MPLTTGAGFYGGTWTDLIAQPSAINPSGPDGAASISSDDGSLRFPNPSNTSCFISFQLPHDYWEGTNIDFHLHGYKVTAGGDALAIGFEVKYVWTNIGGTVAALPGVGWNAMTEAVAFPFNAVGKHGIYEYNISGVGKTFSSIIQLAIRRNVADAYNGEVAVISMDVHYQRLQAGTRQEYVL